MEQDLKSKIDQACRTAEEFTKLYYESLDKRRYLISRLYLDTATLIWNGNGVETKDNIQKFWTDLPPSEHSIITLDAQPITGPGTANQLTFLVKVGGQVKFEEKTSKPFNQTFLITAMGDKWKIKNYPEFEPTDPIESCIKNMCKYKESMRRFFYENFQTYSFTAVPLEEHFHISMN